MGINALICEFNPLHKGHEFIINKAKENPDDRLICIMTGCFAERGEPVYLNPHKRAELAIKAGADMVVELPVPYSVSCGEWFATAGTSIANSLNANKLFFGAENPDINKFLEIPKAKLANSNKIFLNIKAEMKKSASYGKAMTSASSGLIDDSFLNEPNNKLGIEYVTSILKNGYGISPVCIGRKECASASIIRENYRDNIDSLPELTIKAIEENSSFTVRKDEYGAVILQSVRTADPLLMTDCPDASEGLENLVIKNAKGSSTLDLLVESCTNKRYTRARIRRLLVQNALKISKEMQHENPGYARVLAVKKDSLDLLSNPFLIKNKDDEERLTGINKEIFEAEKKAYSLYSLITHSPDLFYSKLQII